LLDPPVVAGADPYRKSPLARDRADEYRRRVLEHFTGERPYLDPDLGLDALARAVGIPAHHLSQTLNQGMGLSFFDFVNRFRVRHAARLLLGPADPDRTVLAVAFDSGFSSKASFNRAFKLHTGLTPTQFRLRADERHPIFDPPTAGGAGVRPAPERVSSGEIRSHPAG
ncbi:MAG TPA: helix-turn-helix domain-containing protein, partial [bacterium]|nr:helix-turn-helix domain-containing protein [bacterium]